MAKKLDHETIFDCDGSITVLEIPHGLGQKPYLITTKVKGTKNNYHTDSDKNNIVLVFSSPLLGKIKVEWSAFK